MTVTSIPEEWRMKHSLHRHVTLKELRAIIERTQNNPDHWTFCIQALGEEILFTTVTADHPKGGCIYCKQYK